MCCSYSVFSTVVGRLPQELLLVIIMLLVDVDPPVSARAGGPYFGWLRMLWVCSSWRTSILGASCVWGRAFTQLPNIVDVFNTLARSSPRTYEISRRIPSIRRLEEVDSSADMICMFHLLYQTEFTHVVSIVLDERGPIFDHLIHLAEISPLPVLRHLTANAEEPVERHCWVAQR